MEISDIVFLVIIEDRKNREIILDELHRLDAALIHTIYGKECTKHNEILEAVGMFSEHNKIVFVSLIQKNKCQAFFEEACLDINRPHTGIAFTVPLNALKY